MKKVLWIGLGIIVLFGLAVSVMPFVHGEPGWDVEESIEVAASVEMVSTQVADLSSWHEWTMWAESDGTLTVEGPASGPGASITWDSSSSNGTLTVTEWVPGERMAYEVDMEGGQGASTGAVVFEAAGDGTRVTWTDTGHFLTDGEKKVGYVAKGMGFLMQQFLSAGFSKNLEGLKAQVEG